MLKRNSRPKILLACFLTVSSSTAQEAGFGPTNNLGFFDLLNASFRTSERPYSFGETVVVSSVIGRGYLSNVIPGRKIANKSERRFPPLDTVLLEITTLNVIKGDYERVFYVEYPISHSVIGELRNKIYTGELLFFLSRAGTFYKPEDAEISISSEAESALGDQPLYELTVNSRLFTMPPDNRLTTPLGYSAQLEDLYADIASFDELQSRIEAIQSSGECEPVVLDHC